MSILFKYIFAKSYYICIKFFKEREFPQYFAAGIFSLVTIMTVSVLMDLFFYQINPSLINFYYGYYKYASVAFLLFCWWFFNRNNRYQKVLEEYHQLSTKTKKVLSVVSIMYVIAILFGFFYMSNLMHDYNLSKI